MNDSPRRILIIRRDNIGDLVCTLPMLQQLRQHYEDAWIGVLVTRYNAEVLRGHPDIDALYTYTKAKHLGRGESRLGALIERLRVLWRLRHADLDLVLLPASGTQVSARRMAKLVGAKRVLSQDDVPVDPAAQHEVLRTANILRGLDIDITRLPISRIEPRAELRELLARNAPAGEGRLIGLHISARKPSQRWPAQRFVELVQALHAQDASLRFLLFWSPGDANNPLHPGDDEKAREVLAACVGLPLQACPTHALADLIAGLSLCDLVVCSDGGHMHLAAALGKPLVCLFGKSEAARWHPWGVRYALLQKPSEDAADIGVEEVASATQALLQRI